MVRRKLNSWCAVGLAWLLAGTVVRHTLHRTFSWAVLDGSLLPPNSIVDGGLGAGLVILLDGTTNIGLFAADRAYSFITPEIVGVPEPTVVALLLSGLAMVGIPRRRSD
jgi:hypothetical protein